jgi:hypothetical protein
MSGLDANQFFTEGAFGDDDCLGYYSDGVKRTLTDEQIAIFRHSEIQNLLRERRLREEEKKEEENPRHMEKTEKVEEDSAGGSDGSKRGTPKSGKGTSNAQRWRMNDRPGKSAEVEDIDYEDGTSHCVSAQQEDVPRSRVTKRKVIVYDDICETVLDNPLETQLSNRQTGQTFLWPRLGE